MLDESRYQSLADAAFRRIEAMLEDVDAEDVDLDRAGDVITLTFKTGKRAVINTQRPTRQIWLAANARAWHFSYDEPAATWLDEKGTGDELIATVARVVEESGGPKLPV